MRAYHAVSRVFYETLIPFGITPQQFGVLIEVVNQPSQSQGSLARKVLATPQSVGELLRTMEEAGLVVRSSDAGRGRPFAVVATRRGQLLLDQVTPHVLAAVSPTALGIDEERGTRLNGDLRAIVQFLTTA